MKNFALVEPTNLRDWTDVPGVVNIKAPRSINMRCAHCLHLASFELRGVQFNTHSGIGSAFSTCAGCSQKTVFVLRSTGDPSSRLDEVYTSTESNLANIDTSYSEGVPPRVVRSIREALNSLSVGASNTAATAAGRTLEGVLKDRIGDNSSGKSLHQLIESASREHDFAEPLQNLARAVKDGRNRGAHFDPDVDVDAESAEIMVQLVDSVISYFYEMPQDINAKIERLDELQETEKSQD